MIRELFDHPVQVILGLLSVFGAIVIWGLRLEGRVSVVEQLVEVHAEERKNATEMLFERLDRIEGKVDTIRVRCAAFHPQIIKALNGAAKEPE